MNLALGIDVGTSKVAAAVVDLDSRTTIETASALHQAGVVATCRDCAEQDAAKLFQAVAEAVGALSPENRLQARMLGLTGQMHGVILWNPETWAAGPLITWQDRRCLRDGFLEKLRDRTGNHEIHSGYGGATLAWLREFKPETFADCQCAGTIMDFLAARVCGLGTALIDPTNACSWGFFDLKTNTWREKFIARTEIPAQVLPRLQPAGSRAGTLEAEFSRKWGLPEGLPVGVACGDHPASLYATVTAPGTDIALTLGTGGQLAVLLPPEKMLEPRPATLEYRPYVDKQIIAVVASLAGGQAWDWLVDSISGWLNELGIKALPREELYEHLIERGLQVPNSSLTIQPNIGGERHDPARRGEIRGLDRDNFTLGNLAAALARGIVENLREMMPAAHLAGRGRVVGSGNAIRRSQLMRETIEECFGLPLLIPELSEEAASGAALLAADRLGTAGA